MTMAEVLFILVILYAAYVIHSVVTCNRKKNTKEKTINTSNNEVKTSAKIVKKEASPIPPKPAKKKPASKKAKAKLPKGSVRNPDSGEVTKIATNYRMTKRWIKEALVTEDLLEKVYKVNEIDDAATQKINKALDKLQALAKYQ
jgi:hypothetical protein